VRRNKLAEKKASEKRSVGGEEKNYRERGYLEIARIGFKGEKSGADREKLYHLVDHAGDTVEEHILYTRGRSSRCWCGTKEIDTLMQLSYTFSS
jgi:hypothetical protein